MSLIIPGANEDDVVYEENSCILEFTLEDSAGAAVAGTDVNTATLQLFDDAGEIITGFDPALDVKAKINVDGLFNYNLTAATNQIFNAAPTDQHEDHLAQVKINFTSAGEVQDMARNIRVRIMNLDEIT